MSAELMIDPMQVLVSVINDGTPDTIRVIQADRPETVALDEYSTQIGTIVIVPGATDRMATYPKGTMTFVARCYGLPNNDPEGYGSSDIARAMEFVAYTVSGQRKGPRVAGGWYVDSLTLGLPQGPTREPESEQWVTLVNGTVTMTLRPVAMYAGGATFS